MNNMYDERTFDDQVIEYFIILVRKQNIVAYSGRENPGIQLHQIKKKKKEENHLPGMLGSIGNATVHYNFPFVAIYVTQDSGK